MFKNRYPNSENLISNPFLIIDQKIKQITEYRSSWRGEKEEYLQGFLGAWRVLNRSCIAST